MIDKQALENNRESTHLDALTSPSDTDYLFSNPKTKKRLIAARDRMDAGKGIGHDLIEL